MTDFTGHPLTPRVTREGVFIGDHSATDLAARFGTPLFAYDAATIRRRLTMLASAIPHRPLHLHYSAKANANIELLRLVRSQGVGMEACSSTDLLLADRAGFQPTQVVYCSSAMTDDDLCRVAATGALFSVDSLSQLERYGRLAAGRDISLRINPGIRAGFNAATFAGDHGSKFGLHEAQLSKVQSTCAGYRLRVVALHGHIGSDLLDDGPHLRLLDLLLGLSQRFPHVSAINIGGGWGIPFSPGLDPYPLERFGREVSARLERHAQSTGRPMDLRVEPGGWAVMDAGVLITRVCEVKPPVHDDELTTPHFVLCDTSLNHVPSAVIYKTYHPIWIASRPEAPPEARIHVCGNLLQAADVLAENRPLAVPREGEVLVIGKCGGYSASRTTTFNQRPRPAEVLVDGPVAKVIRRREFAEDLAEAIADGRA